MVWGVVIALLTAGCLAALLWSSQRSSKRMLGFARCAAECYVATGHRTASDYVAIAAATIVGNKLTGQLYSSLLSIQLREIAESSGENSDRLLRARKLIEVATNTESSFTESITLKRRLQPTEVEAWRKFDEKIFAKLESETLSGIVGPSTQEVRNGK